MVETINRSGIDLPAGKVQTDQENSSGAFGKFNDLGSIQNVQLQCQCQTVLFMKDIANVVDGIKETSLY